MRRSIVTVTLPVALLLGAVAGCPDPADDGNRYAGEPAGRGGPADRCVVCHSLEKDGPVRSAPPLWGIVGADKARFGWFAYSPALARAEGVWTEEELDRFLTDPDVFLPGTAKTLTGIPDPEERRAIIAYLATLSE